LNSLGAFASSAFVLGSDTSPSFWNITSVLPAVADLNAAQGTMTFAVQGFGFLNLADPVQCNLIGSGVNVSTAAVLNNTDIHFSGVSTLCCLSWFRSE
jgi:hypothetical protein